MSEYNVPGVYIEEQTGPGVITGVGTSTAAFVGPALLGPINEALRVTSFDEFLANYAERKTDGKLWPYITERRDFYLAHAVRGFFQNGGRQAYVVRVGTGLRSKLSIENRGGEEVFVVEAQQEGTEGDKIRVATELAAQYKVAVGTSKISGIDAPNKVVTVESAIPFRSGDFVSKNGAAAKPTMIQSIDGNKITLQDDIGLAVDDDLRIADIVSGQKTFRLVHVMGLYRDVRIRIDQKEILKLANVTAETGIVTIDDSTPIQNSYAIGVDQDKAPFVETLRTVVIGSSVVDKVEGEKVTVKDRAQFRVGDFVTKDETERAQVKQIQDNILTLDPALSKLKATETIRIANITPLQSTFRVDDIVDLYPGGLVLLIGDDPAHSGNEVTDLVVVEKVDRAGFVTLRAKPEHKHTYNLSTGAPITPMLIPQEFRLIITTSDGKLHRINNLSIDPFHPRYIFNKTILDEISSQSDNQVRVLKPDRPPIKDFPDRQIKTDAQKLTGGKDDEPTALSSAEYQAGLKVLENIDDVNLICVPDAASHPTERQSIQQALIEHCLQLQDRFALLDSILGASPSGAGSIDEQRKTLQSERGFAALYYPWLEVRDPASNGPSPRPMLIPPCGHIAGVYARTDAEIGVHKAPANADVRGVLGLERRVSDGQHGPLNLAGINVLRIFPSSAQVIIWGARTTVDPNITDWLYVNVRRLMLYIEESIDEGIRWAVFKPNNLALWQQLKRTINDFLTRVWRSGALFGDKPEQAFYVRIDEALNPESTRALGRLYIEIGVAPVRPAEFIIVRIGLWDGGASITEA